MKNIKVILGGALIGFSAFPAIVAAADESAMEEVVVTARYREESVQDSPTSVTAFNQAYLEKLTAQDMRDLAPASPNVKIQPVVTFPNSAAIHIRGMGQQGIESTAEMRTGVSINGVFTSRPIATLIDFFDMETVEVLRGPQGTTFGKNSLAGGIAMTTIRPDGTVDYKAELTGGNYGRRDFRGAVQFPIVEDKLSARISVLAQNYDGHFKNRATGGDLNGEDIDTVRGTIVWTPTDNFDATLIASWLEERSDAPGGDDASDPGQILSFIFSEPDDGAFTVGRDALEFHNTDQSGVTAIINWDLGNFRLTSVTGWIETDDFIASDFDQTEIPFFPTFRDQVHDQFSQEVRLHSDFEGMDGALGNLELVLGFFFFEQEHEMVQSFPTLGPSADYAHQDGDSTAIFGQVIYAVNDNLNLTFGIRRTEESKDFERNPGAFLPTITATDPSSRPSISEMSRTTMSIAGDLDSSNTSVKVGVDYHINDDVMVFVNYSEGFKAGEFGARASSVLTLGPTGDEESQSFEVGIKSELMNGRVRLNATVFQTEFENLQFGVFIPSPNNPTGQETANQNIGEATNRGLEVELMAVPVENLTLQASIGLLDAEYDKFCADLDGPGALGTSDCGGQITDLGGGSFLVDTDHTNLELSRAPDTQYYLAAEYVWPTNVGNFALRASGSFEDDYFSDGVLNHPKAKTGDFWLVDASLTWTSEDDQWRIQGWCKNCSDKEYTSGLTPTANFFNQHFWGLPKMYGLTVSYQK